MPLQSPHGKEPHPGDKYPEECRPFMEATMQCAAAGDIPGCMENQRRASECLMRHGIYAPLLPERYYELMHESFCAAAEGDKVGARLIGERMNELIESLNIGGEVTADDLPVPEECQAIEALIAQAEAEGDFAKGMRLLRDFDRCLLRHGLPSPGLPDEWFEIQIEMNDAHERGDMADFERLRQISEKMLKDACLENEPGFSS